MTILCRPWGDCPSEVTMVVVTSTVVPAVPPEIRNHEPVVSWLVAASSVAVPDG